MTEFQDLELKCVDCQQPFTLTAGEQEFFASKGFTNPKRCKECRKKKTASMRAKEDTGTRPMNDNDFGPKDDF